MFKTGLEELLEKVAIALPAQPGLLARVGRGAGTVLKTTAALGAGGLALGALHQNETDVQKARQPYAPMTGSIYG